MTTKPALQRVLEGRLWTEWKDKYFWVATGRGGDDARRIVGGLAHHQKLQKSTKCSELVHSFQWHPRTVMASIAQSKDTGQQPAPENSVFLLTASEMHSSPSKTLSEFKDGMWRSMQTEPGNEQASVLACFSFSFVAVVFAFNWFFECHIRHLSLTPLPIP